MAGVPPTATRQAGHQSNPNARNRTPLIIGAVAFVVIVALTVGIVAAVTNSGGGSRGGDRGGDRGGGTARLATAYRGTALSVQGLSPYSVDVDPDGSLLVSSLATDRIQKITPAGAVSDLAGTGAGGISGDGGPASAAQLDGPGSTTRDKAGNIYIGDAKNNRIRKISPAGVITTIAGTGDAGYGGAGGPATAAKINGPNDLQMTDDGTLYFADLASDTIQKVTPGGIITTVAGTGEEGFSGDGGPATRAKLNVPSLTVGPDGRTLYLADYRNHRIRRVDPNGVITTIAGTGVEGSGGEGGPAAAAQFKNPSSVAVDGSGALYIADNGNDRVRRIDPNGTITTVAQPG
ncbi:SMP-30/gluconolactonase/LRE family protein [Frankia sp. CcWB3]